MKKMVLMGRSECGKTTLKQALKGKKIQYEKTQAVNYFDVIIDTPLSLIHISEPTRH